MINPTSADVERLIADGQLAIKVMEEMDTFETGRAIFADLIAALRAMQAERDGYRDICNQREEIIQARTARYKAAEATVATLTGQVEAMRGADWQPIETAPKGVAANGKLAVSWMMLAIPDGEGGFHRETGMRVGDRFFAALTFCCGGRFDEKQYELREVEVHPTHWMPRPEAPTLTMENQTNG